MRAPERRVFKIDVGDLDNQQIERYMQDVTNKMKKVPYKDPQTGQINLKYNIQNLLEDFFIPVKGRQDGSSIETLAGMQNNMIEDIEFVKSYMLAALKIPKAFLANEADVNSRATVAAQDLRMARTIDRFHKIIVSELTKICVVHLYTQGYRDEDLIDFELEMFSPSTVYQLEKIELLDKYADLAEKLKNLKLHSDKWIYNNIFNMSDTEAAKEEEGIIFDIKKNWRQDTSTAITADAPMKLGIYAIEEIEMNF